MLFHNLPLITETVQNTLAATANDAAAETVAEETEKSLGYLIVNTTLTGLLVVFFVLLILIAIVSLYGKIVYAITKSTEKKAQQKAKAMEEAKAAANTTESAAPAAFASAKPASGGISGEIIAVISAAVAAIDSRFSVKSVKRANPAKAKNAGGRSAWSNAGLRDNTRPF